MDKKPPKDKSKKSYGTFKVADANLHITFSSNAVKLNKESLRLGKNKDFKKIREGIWQN